MLRKFVLFFMAVVSLAPLALAQNRDTLNSIYSYSLKDLAELKTITGSFQEENSKNSPSNVTIITKQMIDDRGYQTLVDLCQDTPGFDFMMFNDGTGEYSTFGMNRGVGGVGNPNVLIMIDGIVQNNISFNWSLLWTYENMFIDIERVEIIQGPGSVLYGAQAFTGVIHLITKKRFTGAEIKSTFGSNFTFSNDVLVGTKLTNELYASVAFHIYHSDGDKGLNRYDPGGYFTNNKYPAIILADYDNNGNYVQNIPNPKGGKTIPSGFNTEYDSYAIRGKLTYKKSELGGFISNFDRGGTSTYLPYEYNLTSTKNKGKYRSYHIYANNSTELSPKLNLSSNVVFRGTDILPEVGFEYLYRFTELTKSYASYAYQGYVEEKIFYRHSKKTSLYIGLKAMLSQKSERMVSLGTYTKSKTKVSSSWDDAVAGNGLNKTKLYPTFLVKEFSSYAIWDNKWLKTFSSSVGLRYDLSSEFGQILNPRFAITYNQPNSAIGAKFLFGSAFRQPGIFELTSEFRGNLNLTPEKIRTTEVEINSLLLGEKLSLKATLFYSEITDFIGTVTDASMPAGERYENLNNINSMGVTAYLSTQISKNLTFYSNYNYLTGVNLASSTFYEIEKIAKHKINAGINLSLLDNKFITDVRINMVGKRKAQDSNRWLQTYNKGYADSYTKANLVVSYYFAKLFNVQLVVNNMFNTQYYGIGRESGSGFIDEYDYQSNVNPSGFIPSYHPQPGRQFLVNLIYRIH